MHTEQKSFYADMFSKASHGDQSIPPSLETASPPLVPLATEALPLNESITRIAAKETLPVPVGQARQTNTSNPASETSSVSARLRKISPLAEIIGAVDTHHLSPRKMANLSLDLYIAGAISFEDYAELAFQPELHPNFNQTIGALTGETAEPDRPRDFVRLWEEKAEFQHRHNNERSDLIEQSKRISSLLDEIGTSSRVRTH